MAASDVYSPTTAPNPKTSWFLVPSAHLDKIRFAIKVLEVLMSLVAFVLEESVTVCTSCGALYFFEFVSCTAFLFTFLLLVLLSTPLHQKVAINCWGKLDFFYTAAIALLFLISSIVFAADNSSTSVETVAVAFGFLATLAFSADLGYSWRTRGSPFQKGDAPASTNGGPQMGGAPPEVEKLTADANGGH